MSADLWPTRFSGHRNINLFFVNFCKCIWIDSAWSKMYDFEINQKQNPFSFHQLCGIYLSISISKLEKYEFTWIEINNFMFQNILHILALFLLTFIGHVVPPTHKNVIAFPKKLLFKCNKKFDQCTFYPLHSPFNDKINL